MLAHSGIHKAESSIFGGHRPDRKFHTLTLNESIHLFYLFEAIKLIFPPFFLQLLN